MIMIGNNELHLCPAALMKIIEDYLAEVVAGPPHLRVLGLDFEQDGGTTMTIVTLTSDPAAVP